MDTSDPLIEFDEKGRCNYCSYYEGYLLELGSKEERESKTKSLVRLLRKAGEGKDYDCIIGLSGGVDSSLVTALSAKSSYEKFSSFHMRWNNIEGKIDESEFAQKVVDKYDLKNFTKNITEIDIPNLLAKFWRAGLAVVQ